MSSKEDARMQRQDGEGDGPDLMVGAVSLARRLGLSMLLLLLVLGAFFAALLVARGSPVHGVLVDNPAGSFEGPSDPLFRRAMQLHAGVEMTEGNKVEIVLNGDSTYSRMWADIRAAQRSVTVQMYYFTPGVLADTLSSVLRERAAAGVDVLLLLDAFGARTVSRTQIAAMRDAGVTVAYLRPLKWYKLADLSHRSHVRFVIVDGTIGYTGGFGFGDEWLGDARNPAEWRETNVRVEGPVVAQMQAAFMVGWVESTGMLHTSERYFPYVPAATDEKPSSQAGLVFFAPTIGASDAERFLALSMLGARKRLYITNSYFVPDVQFRRMLVESAKRGVDVRILVAGERTDVAMTLHAGRARYDELLSGGVRVYEYWPTMIHAKTIVIDGEWLTVGSLNFDNRSLSYNDESNLVVHDAALGAQLDSIFLRDIARANEIKLEEFERRSLWQRFLEFCSNLASGIL